MNLSAEVFAFVQKCFQDGSLHVSISSIWTALFHFCSSTRIQERTSVHLPRPAWWRGQRPQLQCWRCLRRTRGIPRGSRRSWGKAPIRSSSPRKAAMFHITPVQLLNVASYWDLCIDYPHHMIIIYFIIQTPRRNVDTLFWSDFFMSMLGSRNSVGSGSTAPFTSLMWPGMMEQKFYLRFGC